jgi:hypothetical protein
MVYKRPDYNPQPDDGYHGKGWNPAQPSWGDLHQPFPVENFGPKRPSKKGTPPAVPKPPAHTQPNLFEANGVKFNQFNTSGYQRKPQGPLPDQPSRLDPFLTRCSLSQCAQFITLQAKQQKYYSDHGLTEQCLFSSALSSRFLRLCQPLVENAARSELTCFTMFAL